MALVLTEDQELLAQTARDFVRTNSPVSRLRALRDGQDGVGFSPDLWQEMAQLGWAGILIPEEYGGAGLGLADLAVVLEAVGRNLAPEPFLSTVLLGGQLLADAGSPEQKQAWLSGIATGKKILALAYQEARSRYDLNRVFHTCDSRGRRLETVGRKDSGPGRTERGRADCLGPHQRRRQRPGRHHPFSDCTGHARRGAHSPDPG